MLRILRKRSSSNCCSVLNSKNHKFQTSICCYGYLLSPIEFDWPLLQNKTDYSLYLVFYKSISIFLPRWTRYITADDKFFVYMLGLPSYPKICRTGLNFQSLLSKI